MPFKLDLDDQDLQKTGYLLYMKRNGLGSIKVETYSLILSSWQFNCQRLTYLKDFLFICLFTYLFTCLLYRF